ncbi:hypothetical protein Trco_001909 [Trichoderma cornu-damae]|uniref:Uncharacterized protein n=1 Tax=Trichoderma cornu-damae TaxID=654480 RepID=A0A9P8QTN6_9HYPO|nr:hypothetical protein Trco_001909 [Trichoderma cornu-damae]
MRKYTTSKQEPLESNVRGPRIHLSALGAFDLVAISAWPNVSGVGGIFAGFQLHGVFAVLGVLDVALVGRRLVGGKDVAAGVAFLCAHVNDLVGRHHLVDQRPPEPPAQLRHDDVAVAQQVDVEVDVGDGLAGNVDLRDMGRQEADNLGHGRDLERGANHNDQVHLVPVVFREAAGEFVGQGFAEKGNVGLHDARAGDVVVRVLVRAVVARPAPPLLLGAGGPLPLRGGAAGGLERREAPGALGDLAGPDVREDVLAPDLVAALDAAGGAERAVVNVLGVVGEELAALVEHGQELVGGRVPLGGRDDVLGDRVEDGRVLLEHVNVEDLLRVAQAQVLQLGVQAGPLGSEVGDAQGGGDAGAGDDDDVAALFDEADGIVHRVVARQLGPLGQLPRDGQREEAEVGIVGLAVEKGGRPDAESAEELLGAVATGIDGALAEDGRALFTQFATQPAGLLWRASVWSCGIHSTVVRQFLQRILKQRIRLPRVAHVCDPLLELGKRDVDGGLLDLLDCGIVRQAVEGICVRLAALRKGHALFACGRPLHLGLPIVVSTLSAASLRVKDLVRWASLGRKKRE